MNITFSQDNSADLRQSQTQDSKFKPDGRIILESGLPGDFDDDRKEDPHSRKRGKAVEHNSGWNDPDYIKIDDAYSFSYTLSKHAPNSESEVYNETRKQRQPKLKNKDLKRIISKNSHAVYKPKFLKSGKFTKSKNKNNWRAKAETTRPVTARVPGQRKQGVTDKFSKQISRKSAHSRIVTKSHKKRPRKSNLKPKTKSNTDRKHKTRINTLSAHERILTESHDLFVEKSVNRLLNLEDLQQVITKSKKHLRRSKSKKTSRITKETSGIQIKRLNPENPTSKYLVSLGYKSHNSSIKLKRKRRNTLNQGLSLQGHLGQTRPGKNGPSEMLNYFSTIRINNSNPVHDEYNFRSTYTSPVNFRKKVHKNMSDSKDYPTHLRTKMGNGPHFQEHSKWRGAFDSPAGSESRSESGSVSKSTRNKVSISRVFKKDHRMNQLSGTKSGVKSKTPKKFKITSLAQILQKTSKPTTYLKNKRNQKNHLTRVTKSNNKFRIISRTVKPATPDHSTIANNLSNYLKISTIKPFEVGNEDHQNHQTRPIQKKKSGLRALIGTPNINRKQLESYGFLERDQELVNGKSRNSKKKTTDYFFKSKSKTTTKRKFRNKSGNFQTSRRVQVSSLFLQICRKSTKKT